MLDVDATHPIALSLQSLDQVAGDEAARATNQSSLHEVEAHRFATTIIVTKLAIIWATVANTGKMSVFSP